MLRAKTYIIRQEHKCFPQRNVRWGSINVYSHEWCFKNIPITCTELRYIHILAVSSPGLLNCSAIFTQESIKLDI